LQFNWWETKNPIISEKGVLLKAGSYFKIIDKKILCLTTAKFHCSFELYRSNRILKK
jgi:hypothetical protein